MCSLYSTLQHKKYIIISYKKITDKTSKEPLKKVQTLIVQQRNMFRSGYIDSQSMSSVSCFMKVTVVLLCSLPARFLQVKKL